MGSSTLVKILTGITGGGAGLAVVAIIASIAGFNSENFFHDDKIGIQFGMQIDATSQEIKVWIHAPKALFIRAVIGDILKYDDNGGGDGNEAGLGDLFPIGAATYGSGTVSFEIFTADEEMMPDLVNRDQSIVPMAYIRKESQFPAVIRYILLMGAHTLNYWTLFKFSILGGALMLVVLGFVLRYVNKKSTENLVTELKEDVS